MATATESTVEALRERGEEVNEAVREAAGRARNELEPMLRRADELTRRMVTEHPLGTLVGAVAAGYLIGRILAIRR
jgi:ElaB/YqjD/DUF883 family membrane-anchored ribosome-binding protein